jgi:hypothetical protein
MFGVKMKLNSRRVGYTISIIGLAITFLAISLQIATDYQFKPVLNFVPVIGLTMNFIGVLIIGRARTSTKQNPS